MSNNEIIEKLAKERVVEMIVARQGLSTPYKKDLCQDIYLDLLKKDCSLVAKLDDSGEMSYYITKMVKNNINSTTSPFYKNYEKFRKNSEELKDEKADS